MKITDDNYSEKQRDFRMKNAKDYNYLVEIVFKDKRRFVRKNLTKKQAVTEYNRYLRDMSILQIQQVGWELQK
jgi:hypothetical protein